MQHTILHWLLGSCLFMHTHRSRKQASLLCEVEGGGRFDVCLIMKIYSDNCHNYVYNDDDLNVDDDKD